MTAENIRDAIRNRFSDHRRYAVAEEVGLTTGYSHRRLDVMVLDCYNSNGFRIDGFEIKTSTSDLRRELEDPEKHVAFFDVIDYYTLAAPSCVIDPLIDVIPKKWGILIVNDDGSTRFKRRPLALEDKKAVTPVSRGFLASIVRSIQERQPSSEELRREYERGLSDGAAKANSRYGYMKDRVEKEHDRLVMLDQLEFRFKLYGENIDEVMDKFEAFRKADPDLVHKNMKRAIEAIQNADKWFMELCSTQKNKAE